MPRAQLYLYLLTTYFSKRIASSVPMNVRMEVQVAARHGILASFIVGTRLSTLLGFENHPTFGTLVQDISAKGYSVQENVLPLALGALIMAELQSENVTSRFKKAGVGRHKDFHVNELIRTDTISWIDGDTAAGAAWGVWTGEMQVLLNEQLFLGLFTFESHFAHYGKGDFYLTHHDAFKGEGNRRLSIVMYLNPNWLAADAGELVLHVGVGEAEVAIKVAPKFGTLVAFLSEDIPHEVLVTEADRFSIAGWFRVNGSHVIL